MGKPFNLNPPQDVESANEHQQSEAKFVNEEPALPSPGQSPGPSTSASGLARTRIPMTPSGPSEPVLPPSPGHQPPSAVVARSSRVTNSGAPVDDPIFLFLRTYYNGRDDWADRDMELWSSVVLEDRQSRETVRTALRVFCAKTGQYSGSSKRKSGCERK